MIKKAAMRIFLLSTVLLPFFTGCNTKGTVVDVSGIVTNVSHLRTEDKGMLRIFCSGAVKEVPLESIDSVLLYPEESRTVNNEFCFLADIFLYDGSNMTPFDSLHGISPHVFIPVNQTISGEAHKGRYMVRLAGVMKFSIYHKVKDKKKK
jgi:hypothetical protein